MFTRLQHVHPPTDGVANPLKAPVCVLEPASYLEWLLQLKRQSIVRVRTHTGHLMPPATLTNDSPKYLFIGKLKFRRGDGWQVKRNAGRCYRMRLRLVRDAEEVA
jgi:hypothetical protein